MVSISVPARRALFLAIVASVLLVGVPAFAQPFGGWLTMGGSPATGHVEVPASADLNPTDAFTFEAWVSITNSSTGEDCRSIAGKNWQEAWWVGLCTVSGRPTLRSYLQGSASMKQGGEIEPGRWTHVAVVFDGVHRLHYINGELAATFDETGPLTTSASAMSIGSDVAWAFPPDGAIDEVRLWNVARTESDIRTSLGRTITSAQPGLVAAWALDGSPNDVVGPHDGSTTGTEVGFLTFPVAPDCGATTATSLCLLDRFSISARWRTDPAGTLTNGQAQVAGSNNGSGLFQFFGQENWEILAKSLNGCAINNHYWFFSAATTNVFYRIEVLDVMSGTQKIYFNYQGPPAPAVTDTAAFATCP